MHEIAKYVYYSDKPHMIGVQFTKIVKPAILTFKRPTAKEASVYAAMVKCWDTGR
jgi:hypothetical protein